MALQALSDTDKYKLQDSDQDLRGKPLVAEDGRKLGEIREMLADTDQMQIVSVALTDGRELPVRDLEIRDRDVVLHDRRAGAGRPAGHASERRPGNDRDAHQLLIPVIEEELVVGTRPVAKGGVHVHTDIQEKQAEKPVTLKKTEVKVERHPADRPATEADIKAANVDTDVVSSEEEPIVRKSARVVEEVVITTDSEKKEETVHGTVRRTEPRIDDIDKNKRPEERRK